jgi:hypothetical protein
MINMFEAAAGSPQDPQLVIRSSPHLSIWSVWAVLEGTPSEEIFEGPSEADARSWIMTGGQAWLEDRRRKRAG